MTTIRRNTLFASILGLLSPVLYADDFWTSQSPDEVRLENRTDVSLSEINKAMSITMEEASSISYLTLKESSIVVDESSIFQFMADMEHGGPSGVAFVGTVNLTIDRPLVFEDALAGFMLGIDPVNALAGEQPAHLTLNLSKAFGSNLDWLSSENEQLGDLYSYTFFKCQFFTTTPNSEFTVLLDGNGVGAKYGDYTYVGYLRDASQLQEGQIAILPNVTLTSGVENVQDNWPGMTLALVAKPQVGSNAPDLNLPEPTTGTLSLLALAGLAARRRRK